MLPGKLRVLIDRVPAAARDELALNRFDVDGQSYLETVAAPASPQLAANPTPGRVRGDGTVVTALTEPLEVGAVYVVSYEVLADGGTKGLFFADNGGSPFPFSAKASFALGRHKIIVVAQSTEVRAMMRVNGDLTFGFVSCRKAEWQLPLPDGVAHPELATLQEPGALRGDGTIVSSLKEPLEIGTSYTLRYHIRSATWDSRLFTAPNAGSPFAFVRLPSGAGHHAVTLVAQNSDASAVLRLTGEIDFAAFSCRKEGGVAGRQIEMDVTVGSARSRKTIYTPDPGELFVSPMGDDKRGTGAFGSPFRTPGAACAAARPGDTVYLRPGVYAPFEIPVSGTEENPITVRTLPGEEHQAVIEGDLLLHRTYGGPGIPEDEATRDGIYIRSQDYLHIRDLAIRNIWRCGIFVRGDEGEQHGHHVLANNLITMTGSSAIYVGGNNSSTIIPRDEPRLARVTDVVMEYNDLSKTNVITDYNDNPNNPQGEPGGVAEAISVAANAANIITRYNDVHDTRQYGIDYKAGVRGGEIYGNRVWNVERYGIYLDTGRRFVEDVAIYNNHVWNCDLGIVLAREAGNKDIDYDVFTAQEGPEDFLQTLSNIDVYNNLVWDTNLAGIYCQRHPKKDGPDGVIRDIRIRFNTVYNANRAGTGRDLNLSGWSDADFEAAGVVSNVDFIGNIVWNDTAEMRILNTFVDKPGFLVADNLIGVDPSFAAPDATPPDLSLAVGSAAEGLAGATVTETPFTRDIDAVARDAAPAAGAYAARADVSV